MSRDVSRLGIGDLLAAGPRAVSRYTGTLLSVFVVQSLVMVACMLSVALVLAQAFSHLPMFDEAVDGNVVAIVYCLKYGKPAFTALAGIVLGVLFVWQLISWFLVGGIYGVLAQRPEGRRETARTFGASGAATYLTFARLAICALPGWILVLFAFGIGMGIAAQHIEHALTLTDLFGPLVLGALPSALLLHFFWTVEDYARVELALRQETHAPGVVATYLRSFAYVVRRPVTLVHGAIGWILFAIITVAYAYLASGHAMYGATGAVTLFAVRQGVSLLRMAIRFGILGGQLELGQTRPLPPRRVVDQPSAES